MRVVIALALSAIMLSGCMVSYENSSNSTTTTSSSTCSINGQDCDAYSEPTGPQENITIDEGGDATEGVSKTYTWSVHPNATEASVRLVFSSAAGTSPADRGGYGYALIGPGSNEGADCSRNGNVNVGVSSNPDVAVDKQGLAVGDWSLRVCMDTSTDRYDVDIIVQYP